MKVLTDSVTYSFLGSAPAQVGTSGRFNYLVGREGLVEDQEGPGQKNNTVLFLVQ